MFFEAKESGGCYWAVETEGAAEGKEKGAPEEVSESATRFERGLCEKRVRKDSLEPLRVLRDAGEPKAPWV